MPNATTPNKITRKDIESYLLPELENMRALLEGLDFKHSLAVLVLLQEVLKHELSGYYE